MQRLVIPLMLLVSLVATQVGRGAEPDTVPMSVLYLSRTGDAGRTKAFTEFLTRRFERCQTVKGTEFQPELLRGVDVVIVDWPQNERNSSDGKSPLGELETWQTPTVFLGSAGLLMAEAWNVIGDAG